ncbi:hypothetical protein TEA_004388 [Camellia sinensis var. sinensis]|uniref:Fungal lipase-like domain-containing protein n=1 Tax=Camellia sinensis var. sinensis TaxID=542762 RepID=A0A4S4D893_CAMSN|nr:hypothetical protein TEA_004388 [Camellia sinensis var. sinensis]
MIYLDHDNADIVVAIRGLNVAKESDYKVLLDNKLGQTKFNGGYVHNGLLKAAQWVLDAECEVFREVIERYPSYTLTFAGHSLGAGVVTLLTILVIQNREKFGNIERKRIRCFAIAPARCISLNLALRYADVINSVVLQDDFLPRTTMALEVVYKSFFCLPCILCLMCVKDTCTLEDKMLKDPRRLYAPGRLYHIIVRKPFRIGKAPPIVRTAVPVDGRFEHIVLSCNLISDHSIIWIERESQNALDGWRLPDMMFATKCSLSDACNTIAKQLENVYSSIAASFSSYFFYYICLIFMLFVLILVHRIVM